MIVLCVCVCISSQANDKKEQLAKLIYHGNFEEAEKELKEYNKPELKKLKSILKKYNELIRKSKEKRKKRYQELIEEAKKKLKENDIEKALSALRKAKFYSAEEKKFKNLDLVKKITKLAEKKAKEYFEKHNWLKAGNLYAELSTIWDENKEYEDFVDICAKHIRYEAVYKKNSDWQDLIEDIRVEVVPEVSFHVGQFYVSKPDFEKMTLKGLDALKTMAELPKLSEVFPGFKNKKHREKFSAEIEKLIAQVKEQKLKTGKFDKKELWQAFFKLLIINQDTCNLPDEVVIKEFTDAALDALDPFTGVIWPAEVDDFAKHTTGKFSGVGIQITMENNKIKVITPIPGTPAYRAGIMPGDYIISINGKSAEGITLDQAVRKITGPKGTKVTLGILHPLADKPVEITLIRDTIVIHTVKGYKLDENNNWKYIIDPKDKIAYIRITNFTDTTVPDLKKALNQIKKQSARALILDLRFNPGGTLRSAVEVVDLFINRGLTIVSTKGRATRPWKCVAKTGQYLSVPIIVLVNAYSASASEIVSGALKDHKRALIVGERSFGKGSVQNIIGIVDDTCKLKITTAYYYLPSGKCIHKKDKKSKDWGVSPDVEIKLTPEEIKDVLEIQRESEVVRKLNNGNPTTKPTTQPTKKGGNKKVDIQLKAAETLLKARLLLGKPWNSVIEEKAIKPITD